jgi:hypothetical protein
MRIVLREKKKKHYLINQHKSLGLRARTYLALSVRVLSVRLSSDVLSGLCFFLSVGTSSLDEMPWETKTGTQLTLSCVLSVPPPLLTQSHKLNTHDRRIKRHTRAITLHTNIRAQLYRAHTGTQAHSTHTHTQTRTHTDAHVHTHIRQVLVHHPVFYKYSYILCCSVITSGKSYE